MDFSTDPASTGIEWLRERLHHLQTLSAALAAARTEQQAIEATLNQGLDLFEADQAVIATLDEAGTHFRIRAVRGYPEQVEIDWSAFPNSDEYPLSEAVRQQEPIIIYGPDELKRRYPKLSNAARSAALVCLPMGDFGGIALGYDREITFNEAELDFMRAVARQCAEAIRRTELDGERRRRAQRLALLAEAGCRASPARSTTAPPWPRWRSWRCRGWPTAASWTCWSRPGCTRLRRCTSSLPTCPRSHAWRASSRPTPTSRTARSARCCAREIQCSCPRWTSSSWPA